MTWSPDVEQTLYRPAWTTPGQPDSAFSGGLLESALDEGEAALGLLAKHVLFVGDFGFQAVKFVGDGQRREHGEFLGIDDSGGLRDSVHFLVHELRKPLDVLLFKLSANGVNLTEDLHFYGHDYRPELYRRVKLAGIFLACAGSP